MTAATAEVTTNADQQLYVIPCGRGYSCLGFDVCLNKGNAIAAWLRSIGEECEDIPADLRGTLEAYARYTAIVEACHDEYKHSRQRCPAELCPQLIGLEGKRVEVVDAYGETRRFIVGKSTGWIPCHLEIKTRRSMGGCAVTGAPFQSVRVLANVR